jgi:tRNA nucleotidyltransferase (CCA-adding enzyme)
MLMNIPKQVIFTINTLNNNGYKAYIVGGCVRDRIMNKLPSDWDIATSAHPNEVKSLFEKTYDTGIKHGTITVIIDNIKMEVTTFRMESSYSDYRRPSGVIFTDDIITDLSRRDFTINAMAYDISENRYIDPYNGHKDINDKRIKCVGIPGERFIEDPLRMLRAIRFSCQLGFDIERNTYLAIVENSKLIDKISCERIKMEMDKILVSPYPQRILIAVKTGLLKHIIPEFESTIFYKQGNPYHIYTVGVHSLIAIKNLEKDIILRWTMLLHDIGKPVCKSVDEKGIAHFYKHSVKSVYLAEKVLKRLKFDKKSTVKILRLIKWHDRPLTAERNAVIKAIRSIGIDIFDDILKIRKADIIAQNRLYLDDRLKKLGEIRNIYEKIIIEKQCVTIDKLDITGEDLIEIGFKEGKDIGIILNKLLSIVIEHPEKNKKQELLDIVKKKIIKPWGQL